ncbi:hypothetical protein B0T14DRAFT_565458 [Immersiella caudata]|uniref:Uncharacterized protein n=1 Tax=Immersiella caudata TaxID=314043 RepID=A0AA39WZN3_9PEZI|nr:hypothetical protein B0T14DRAFT_565458 [Immersiella caudata]
MPRDQDACYYLEWGNKSSLEYQCNVIVSIFELLEVLPVVEASCLFAAPGTAYKHLKSIPHSLRMATAPPSATTPPPPYTPLDSDSDPDSTFRSIIISMLQSRHHKFGFLIYRISYDDDD